MMGNKTKWMCATLLLALVTTQTQAASVTPIDATDGDFIAGDGIPVNNFTINTANSGESVALKARGRDSGQALSQDGNMYFVEPGVAASNANRPWWTIDFQFSPGDTTNLSSSYQLELKLDYDPSESGTSFFIIDLVVGDADSDASNSWDDGDGFFTNPGGGAWSSDDVPFVVSQSWNLGFFPGTPAYDVNAPGVYDIMLTVYGGLPGAQVELASTMIQAKVIPTPAAAMSGLVMFGVLGAMTRRRRRNAIG